MQGVEQGVEQEVEQDGVEQGAVEQWSLKCVKKVLQKCDYIQIKE